MALRVVLPKSVDVEQTVPAQGAPSSEGAPSSFRAASDRTVRYTGSPWLGRRRWRKESESWFTADLQTMLDLGEQCFQQRDSLFQGGDPLIPHPQSFPLSSSAMSNDPSTTGQPTPEQPDVDPSDPTSPQSPPGHEEDPGKGKEDAPGQNKPKAEPR